MASFLDKFYKTSNQNLFVIPQEIILILLNTFNPWLYIKCFVLYWLSLFSIKLHSLLQSRCKPYTKKTILFILRPTLMIASY